MNHITNYVTYLNLKEKMSPEIPKWLVIKGLYNSYGVVHN